MYLRNIDIVGFRGISRLSMTLRPNMVLIGENAWGKSSLLDALSLIFNAEQKRYQFLYSDFHVTAGKSPSVSNQITLLFSFSNSFIDEHLDLQHQCYQALFIEHQDQYHRVYLKVSGERTENEIQTYYDFIDQNGEEIYLENKEEIITKLLQYFPVFRFRDARLKEHRSFKQCYIDDGDGCNHLFDEKINALVLLLQYYFFHDENKQLLLKTIPDPSVLWSKVKQLCSDLRTGDLALRQTLFEKISQFFIPISEKSEFGAVLQPIVLFEDPDARLHPRMVAIIWELMQFLPIQRITTTNSVELLSQVELRSICRLVRSPNAIKAYQLSKYTLSKQALRRLTFHIHYNRSIALFANAWILVEGETEVWLLSALAEQLGINLELEGIRIVEFAQSGLTPLLKYVKAMGIEWHVLTDGDIAGKKYAEAVKSMLDEHETTSERLTILPKSDIEHFLYFSGFASIFIHLSRWKAQGNYYPATKIIQQAIRRTSKPDLALALASEIQKRGKESIPTLFTRLFSRVINFVRE
ncbi:MULTISPECIES: DUF2813 domain-containing protein [Glaesserella]|uniref:ATP-dependent endonuclease n=1 Tax=Glaesserella australis TaxID=2094024 RepID=A0A328C4H8_9PAST|nr:MULTISPECIES: DUF2813 domain-containing protein [Glaesserella]AUI66352.1 ATP-dependent endonuclease [Glaesserella sp. 15-184]RAL19434.1 ATP-dependent endonuclease [Glaesserella australis]